MILVKKGYFFFALFVTLGLLLFLGLNGYITAQNRTLSTGQQLKYCAENSVFMSVNSVIAVLIIFFIMNRRSIHVLNELDKIAQLSRYGKHSTGDYLKKLGRLGEKIDTLFLELSRLNEMKSLKISALSNLNLFFLEQIQLKLFITDVTGRVLHCSRKFLDQMELDKSRIVGTNISTFIQNLNFNDAITEIEQNRKGILKEKLTIDAGERSFESSLELYPIFNAQNELSNIICISEKETILREISKKTEQINVNISKAQRRITDLFKRKRK